MASSVIILGLLVIFGIAEINCQYGPPEDCNITGILRCKDNLESFYGRGFSLRILADYKGFCSMAMNTLSCFKRKLKSCSKDEKRRTGIINATKSDATQWDTIDNMLKTICSEDFEATYEDLNNEWCYEPIEREILKCSNNFEQNFSVTTQGTTELMYKPCWAYDEYRKCFVRISEKRCSKKVANVLNTLLSTLTNKLQCELYISGKELCDQYLPYMSSNGNFGQPLLWILHCYAVAILFIF